MILAAPARAIPELEDTEHRRSDDTWNQDAFERMDPRRHLACTVLCLRRQEQATPRTLRGFASRPLPALVQPFARSGQVAEHQILIGSREPRTARHFSDHARPFVRLFRAGARQIVTAGATRDEYVSTVLQVGDGRAGPFFRRPGRVARARVYDHGRARNEREPRDERRAASMCSSLSSTHGSVQKCAPKINRACTFSCSSSSRAVAPSARFRFANCGSTVSVAHQVSAE